MRFKMIIIFILYFTYFNYIDVDAKVITDNLNVYNMDVGSNFVAYEYEKSIDDKNIHYVGIYNKMTNEFFDITNNDGNFINNDMFFPSISTNDKYLTYTSRATNIVENNGVNMCFNLSTNGYEYCSNIYVYDIEKRKSYLIKNGEEYLNGDSYISKISGDGSFVVFESNATNNINFNEKHYCYNDKNNICTNIFKYNIYSKSIFLVSSNSDNMGGNYSSITPSVSYDGRYVTFQSLATNLMVGSNYKDTCKNIGEEGTLFCSHIYLFDSYNNSLTLVSKINNYKFNNNSGNAKISGNGKVIVYESYATNVEDKYNNKQHVILYDIMKEKNIILSKNNGILNNRDSYFLDVSFEGKYALIKSNSTNLNKNGKDSIYIYNIEGGKLDFYKEYIEFALLNQNQIYSYANLVSECNLIDSIAPVIEKNQVVYMLKNSSILLKNRILVKDNLSKEVEVYVEDNLILNKVGEYEVFVSAVDEFGNFSKEVITIVILEEDNEAPLFNDLDKIKVLKGSNALNLSNYLTAVDKIDGNTKIYIIDDGGLNLNVKGQYKIKLMSKDNSNNKVYKEIEILVYENYDFQYIYEILLILGVAVVIIFSIIKVK